MDEQRMDNPQTPESQEPEKPVYTPRPKYQIWAAWIGLGIMTLGIILYYWHIASGGML